MNFRLDVPADLPESRLDGCDIIDVSYELRFAVEVIGGWLILLRYRPCGPAYRDHQCSYTIGSLPS